MPLIHPASLFPLQFPNPSPLHFSCPKPWFAVVKAAGSVSARPSRRAAPKSRDASEAAGSVSTRPRRRAAPKSRDASEAAELVRVVLRKSGDGKEPLVVTLSKFVRVIRTEHCFLLFEELGKGDNWLQCLEVFRWMQKQRWYIADNGIYSKLISVMGKKGQTRMAMWLFSEMRNSGCRPDTSVYNALITAHLHSRDKSKALAKAIGYFEKMKGIERCRPNIVTYNILLRAFAQAGDVKQVETLFKDLDESIISPDVYTYNGVMDAYGKNGMLKEMEAVLLRMKSSQCKPDSITFNLLIDAYGRRQAFDKMEQVFKSLLRSKEKPTLPTFNSMITNYGKARLKEKAEYVLKKMADLGFKPSYITYECLMTTYGYCDCVSKAREIFDEMLSTQKEIQISTLNAMLEAYCMNGLPHEADQLLDYSIKRNLVPNASTYKLLYKAYAKANMKELINNLLKHMDEQGIVPNKRFFLEALETFGSTEIYVASMEKTSFLISLAVASCLVWGARSFGLSSELVHRFSDEARTVAASRGGFGRFPHRRSEEYYRMLARSDLRRLGARYQMLFPSEGSETVSLGNDFGWLYYTWINIGTPNVSFLVALDAGSDLLWIPCDCIQCAPLSGYHGSLHQSRHAFINTFMCSLVYGASIMQDKDLGLYNPAESRTSRYLSCSHELCSLRSSCGNSEQHCPYNIKYYSENTSSSGLLVEDILHLASTEDRASVQASVIIGCGRKQSGGYLDGIAPDGLLGLGFGDISVPSFLARNGLIQNSFSLCFRDDNSGRLLFGDEGLSSQQSTPFVPLDGKYITYIIAVESLCIGSRCPGKTSFHALVDSGSSFTFLPDNVYKRVTMEFDTQVNVSRLATDNESPWEYCYEASPLGMPAVPTVKLIFGGNKSFTAVNPIFLVYDNEGELAAFCLALQSSQETLGTIGQNFMTGYHMVFDRENLKLGWSQSDCRDLDNTRRMPLSSPPHNRPENPLPTNEQHSSPSTHAVSPVVAGRAPLANSTSVSKLIDACGASRNLRGERRWVGGARGGGRGAPRQWATEAGSDPATLRLSHELRHGGPQRAPVDPPRIEDTVFGKVGENHDYRVAYQGGRLVEEPLAVDDFLVAGNSAGCSKRKGVPWNGQMPDNCFKQHNIGLESNACSTSNPIHANMGAAEEANICQLLFDDNASANSKLTFLENDNVRENDLLYYDWSDISNFEDIDTMFRNRCDPTFGQSSNTDGLSWISSSSNGIFGPDDNFTSGFEASTSEFREFNDASTYCANIRSLPGGSTLEVNDNKQSWLTHHSCQLDTRTKQAFDGGGNGETYSALTEFASVNNLGECEPHLNIQMQQIYRQYLSEVEGKGLEPCPSQLLPKENCFMKSDSSCMHVLKPDSHIEDKLLYQDLLLSTTSSGITESKQNSTSSIKISANVISNSSHGMGNLQDLSKDPVMQLKEMVEKPSTGPSELASIIDKQHDNFEQEIGSARGNISLELYSTDMDSTVGKRSSMPSVVSDDISVKAISFHQLQDVIDQLNLRTKLCIRDSLYRLARSAEQRHSFAAANHEHLERTRGVNGTGKSRKTTAYMDIETDTNPIDRSVAHLLFHRSPGGAPRSADDSLSLMSHMTLRLLRRCKGCTNKFAKHLTDRKELQLELWLILVPEMFMPFVCH
ncbi:PPR repeat [Musa troglodytarum]|uniref:PPR repeat n=2 Tax=Musa troglodytarum TaxID=320322 RepID=A0A9E7FV55_9LILI|nr:PPR repeat [Musa troglodytarum]